MTTVTNILVTQTRITTSLIKIIVLVPVMVTKGVIVTRWIKRRNCDLEEGGDAIMLKKNKRKTMGEEDEKKWAKVLVAAAASVCY